MMSKKIKNIQKEKIILTNLNVCDIICFVNLGIAQMVARYLGVVEAVGSNPATQTKIKYRNQLIAIFFISLHNSALKLYLYSLQ